MLPNDFLDLLPWIGSGLFLLLGAWAVRSRQRKTDAAREILEEALEARLHEPLTLHPEIDPARCLGCGACTEACPEGDILRLIDHKAVLVEPTKCVGHGECERFCPTGAIKLVFGTKTKGMELPRLSKDYETNVEGIYIAGELGGMGLIRNAFKQGYLAATHAIGSLRTGLATDVDVLVIGAGPAGLASALTVLAQKHASYLCIEQNSFGGTIANFPRQKLTMTHPAYLPGIGMMKFRGNVVRKEELLAHWQEVRKATGLAVREGVSFQSLRKENGIFHVATSEGEIRAQKVILCLGVRGSPRRLGLKNEDLPKVTYNLIDPEQYQGAAIAVVGGGNSAAEAALMLARAELGNRVSLLVRGDSFDRCNSSNREAVHALAKTGRIHLHFSAEVKGIEADYLEIEERGSRSSLANDYLMIFAGAELPFAFLMSLGVEIEKKFGQARE